MYENIIYMEYQKVNCLDCYEEFEIPLHRDRNIVCLECGRKRGYKTKNTFTYLIEKIWWILFKKNIF